MVVRRKTDGDREIDRILSREGRRGTRPRELGGDDGNHDRHDGGARSRDGGGMSDDGNDDRHESRHDGSARSNDDVPIQHDRRAHDDDDDSDDLMTVTS